MDLEEVVAEVDLEEVVVEVDLEAAVEVAEVGAVALVEAVAVAVEAEEVGLAVVAEEAEEATKLLNTIESHLFCIHHLWWGEECHNSACQEPFPHSNNYPALKFLFPPLSIWIQIQCC